MKRYKPLFENYKKKESPYLIYIQNAELNPNEIKLTKDFTSKTAIDRSKKMIDKGLNPSELEPIKINIDKDGNPHVSDGNARVLTYRYRKQKVDKFFIVKKHSDLAGIEIFLKNLR